MINKFLVSSLLTLGLSELDFRQVQAQSIWEPIISPKPQQYSQTWETSIADSMRPENPPLKWEVVPITEDQSQSPTTVIWEVLENENEALISPSEKRINTKFTPPRNLKEVEALLDTIPLQSIDFKPLLNLSHAVPTASVLSQEEWRLIASTISPFKYASGTGNQNYAIQLTYGLSDTFQISGFYSEADDPLNASIKGLDIRPGNLWEVFGAAARWKFLANKSWSLALNGSLEKWTVGSGGSDSAGKNSGDSASPNIFNDSGKRVETQNFVGSISIPLTWHVNQAWQFTFSPAVSFLPSSQGKGQGGAGEFYGTNPYISGGLLWHPIAELGLTASIAQPIGSGTNSFDKNLKYSRAPIFSGGINWHLNPRIALQGQLTNSFGATPATGLLTLPSDNRLGYSASFVFTADAPDTPQPPLSPIQQSLSVGGITVDTALVPPDKTTLTKLSADIQGNLNAILGFSVSNIFHIDFYRSATKNIPQNSSQARTFANDDAVNWRGSGKAVLASPLRGSPIWSALRISFGRNVDSVYRTAEGYLFAETPLTWEINPKLAVTVSPKIAWSGFGTLGGIGIGTNIQIAPYWELLPEANIVFDSPQNNNYTLGVRWNAFNDIAVEVYGSTASNAIDIGQLLNAEQVRWGGRLIIRL